VSYQLAFDMLHFYNSDQAGITVPARLSLGNTYTDVVTKLDTGSSYCIFQRAHGERLGFDIESGHQIKIYTAVGSFFAFGHNVTLTVLAFSFDSLVYFAKDEDFIRDVLGRHGFLNKVQIGIRDYQGEFYMSRND
jgi:hypothetical protein